MGCGGSCVASPALRAIPIERCCKKLCLLDVSQDCSVPLRRAACLSFPFLQKGKDAPVNCTFLTDYGNSRERSSGDCWRRFTASGESLHIHLFLLGQDESSFGIKANVL